MICRHLAALRIVCGLVSLGGYFVHYDGQAWLPSTSGTTQVLNSVWGDGTSVWAVGQSGTVLRYSSTNKTWGTSPAGVSTTLYGVWAQSASAVYVVGAGGTIAKFDGTSWAMASSGTTANLYGVGGDATQVYAVGDGGGVIQKLSGTTWASATTPAGQTLNSVFSAGAGQYIAVGNNGTILRSSGTACSVYWPSSPKSASRAPSTRLAERS